ncbi:MAG TPA: hypothetical protein ENJ65_05950 [Candidatus Tenderia electrophaga]|uniref:Opioid growth factor receptor (OGFr) conserved domain-containing protein n=1 Tax=Candidatus Tenderia electrophaga TaxID=1748243 RepID=A0A832N406_9GAMM|nr:hypothetical protein [Candidatus Tenderia electrophaga]
MNPPLILFYIGSHPDSRGRYLSEILEQDDVWLEVTHDYIQWLFPNTEKSRVTPGAPTITKEIKDAFLKDEILRSHLRASFNRLLEFYGLVATDNGIKKSKKWDARKINWFVEDTHNNLRITRILKSLMALGLAAEAQQFQQALAELGQNEKDCGIGETARRYWAEAVITA